MMNKLCKLIIVLTAVLYAQAGYGQHEFKPYSTEETPSGPVITIKVR